MRTVLVMVVWVLLAVTVAAGDLIHVSGTVVGSGGTPMRLAHAHAVRPAAHAALASVEVAANGEYALEFEGVGLFLIRFTGVDHEPLDVPIVSEGRDDIRLDTQLRGYSYADFLDQVWVIGDFNRFSRLKNVRAMVRQPDATYVAEVAAPAETLAYQLLGVEAWGRSINGTQWTGLEYDGGGDYRSIVAAAGSTVTLTFDPRALALSEEDPRVTFAPEDADRDTLNRAYQELQEAWRVHRRHHELKDQALVQEAFGEDERASWFTRRLAGLPEIDLDAERADVLQRARGAGSAPQREMLLVYRLALELLGEADPRPPTVQEILANVPPTSPYWSLEPDALGAVRFAGEGAEPYRYLDVLTLGHLDPYVRQAGFMTGIALAELDGDFVRADSYWELWQADSGAVTDDYYLRLLAPDRPVRPGSPVPHFEIASFADSTVTYAPDSFRGAPLLIDFWATWCPPCCGEMPNLHDAYESFGDAGLEILSISFDRKPEDITSFRYRRWPMPWHHAYAEDGFGGDLAKSFGVKGIPKPILVGPDGIVVSADFLLRGPDLQRTLRKVLAP